MTVNLTAKQACVLRALYIEQKGIEPPPEGLLDEAGDITEAKAMDALAQYDADQAAKRAAEIEAAYREGFIEGNGYWDTRDRTIHDAWSVSNTKKSLEAK